MNDKLILVTRATGKQGGAVVSHALQRGFAVRALTRNPNQPAGEALKAKGVDVFQGDMEQVASLGQALRGVYGVFCVSTILAGSRPRPLPGLMNTWGRRLTSPATA